MYFRKSTKPRFACHPMMIFGGSPMSVAAPPTFDARIIGSRSDLAGTCIIFAIDRATGVMRIIVVTLSRRADTTAVTRIKSTSSFFLFPAESRNICSANHSKTPVSESTQTMIIIPVSRAMTPVSTECTA